MKQAFERQLGISLPQKKKFTAQGREIVAAATEESLDRLHRMLAADKAQKSDTVEARLDRIESILSALAKKWL